MQTCGGQHSLLPCCDFLDSPDWSRARLLLACHAASALSGFSRHSLPVHSLWNPCIPETQSSGPMIVLVGSEVESEGVRVLCSPPSGAVYQWRRRHDESRCSISFLLLCLCSATVSLLAGRVKACLWLYGCYLPLNSHATSTVSAQATAFLTATASETHRQPISDICRLCSSPASLPIPPDWASSLSRFDLDTPPTFFVQADSPPT